MSVAVFAATAGAASGERSTVTPYSLNLTLASPSAQTPCVYWGLAKRIYQSLGLALHLTPAGSTEPVLVAAGQFPIGMNTMTQAFPPVAAGAKIVQVFAQTVGNPSDAVTVKAGSPYKTLMDLSGQTVGVVGTSGYSRGGAVLYSKYVVAHGGQPFNIVVQPDQTTLTAQLVNGNIAAAVFPPVFGPQIQAGLLTQILSAKSAFSQSLMGHDVVNATFWGLQSEVAKNKDAIVRLIAGCRIGLAQMQGQTATQIATVLQKMSTFAPSVIDIGSLTTQVEQSWLGFQPPNGGYISKTQWDTTLNTFVGLGLNSVPIDPTASQWTYANNVDMSYWNAATPIVNAYLAKHPKK